MNQLAFDRAVSADLPAILALLQSCELPFADLSAEHLRHFWVCRRDDRVVATVGLEVVGEVGLLRSLAVSPDARGQRLAHRLWGRIRDDAATKGVRQLYLLTTTASELFARWGFQPLARDLVPAAIAATTEYGSLCPRTATLMTIALDG
jgi:amino-acid N-acetyltransferase